MSSFLFLDSLCKDKEAQNHRGRTDPLHFYFFNPCR